MNAAIDTALLALAHRAAPPLRQLVEYAVAGGKHARGSLLLAAGQGMPLPQPALVRAAACLELLHAATLVQDDILDESLLRRRRPSVHSRFGHKLATLASDWMLVESMREAYQVSPTFGEAFTACTQKVIAAAAWELVPPAPGSANLHDHAGAVAQGKTGELFGLALSAPALLAGEPATAAALATRGTALGVAFQYLDDVLDLYGDPAQAGKQLAHDLPAHLLTRPVLDALPGLAYSCSGSQTSLYSPELNALTTQPVREQVLHRALQQWQVATARVLELLPAQSPAAALLYRLAQSMLPQLAAA